LEKQFQVTEADRNAIYFNKRTPNLEPQLKKDQPFSWVETISGFYDVLGLEEKRRLSQRG